MRKYIFKKLMLSIVTLFVIVLVLFLLMELMPGSPFNNDKLSDEQREALIRAYGLDKPVMVRFFLYLRNMFKGDFGVSYNLSINTPVLTMIRSRLPISMRIGVSALLLGSVIGLAIGFLAAFHQGKAADILCMVVSVIGISVPSYIFAIALSYYGGFRFKWLPLLYDFRNPVVSSIMPVTALSIAVMAVIARFTRDEAVSVMKSDYVMFARSQGLSDSTLLFRYVIRNSLMPVITVMTMLLVGLLTGSLVTEQIFAIPGIGFLLSSAITANDYNVVITLGFLYAGIYVVARLILDILYGIIDPRVRLGEK
ncbi:MAG: ABC transporter permease [Oscillospiraceae bacterium]|nr:ABC transporter permease [Oscillospiraceae bacterium]